MWPLVGRLGRAKQHEGERLERQEVPKSQTRSRKGPIPHFFTPRPILAPSIDCAPIHCSTDAWTKHCRSPQIRCFYFAPSSCHQDTRPQVKPGTLLPFAPLSKPPTRTWSRTLNQYTSHLHNKQSAFLSSIHHPSSINYSSSYCASSPTSSYLNPYRGSQKRPTCIVDLRFASPWVLRGRERERRIKTSERHFPWRERTPFPFRTAETLDVMVDGP